MAHTEGPQRRDPLSLSFLSAGKRSRILGELKNLIPIFIMGLGLFLMANVSAVALVPVGIATIVGVVGSSIYLYRSIS